MTAMAPIFILGAIKRIEKVSELSANLLTKYTDTLKHTVIDTHAFTHTHKYTHTQTHRHTHTHTHTHTKPSKLICLCVLEKVDIVLHTHSHHYYQHFFAFSSFPTLCCVLV